MRARRAGACGANPEAILNVTFGADRQFVREGNTAAVQGPCGGSFLTGEQNISIH
jgi:hypothetical protein